MFLRWQTLCNVPALCALLAGGFSPTLAHAQCCCRGGGGHVSGFAPGLLQQVWLQQQISQQQIQQQEVRQLQVQQQQLLQRIKLNRQMRELARKGPETIKAALKDPDAEMRLVAAVVVGKSFPALAGDLIPLLTDSNAEVRQTARRSLIILSNKLDGKPTGRRVDFGPLPNADAAGQKSAALKWTTWLDRQQKLKDDGKTIRFRDTALSALLHRDQKQKDDSKSSAARDEPLVPVAVDRKTNP